MTATRTAPLPEERCELSDLYPSACAHCRPTPAWLDDLRRELLAQPGWVTAVHPGTCCSCGDDYAPGAAIQARRPSVEGRRRWLAECCADEVTADA
jgi:hypothetical protein